MPVCYDSFYKQFSNKYIKVWAKRIFINGDIFILHIYYSIKKGKCPVSLISSLFRRKNVLFIFFLALTLFCSTAFASGPAIRLSAPDEVTVGQTFTVKVLVEDPAGSAITALAATLKWNPAQLEAVGEPIVATKAFGDVLAARNNTQKGLTEILTGSMATERKNAKTENRLFAEQKFKVKEAGKIRINFTTDKNISANGTMCCVGDTKTTFAILTPHSIIAK